jgi:hypothetical protein
MNRPTFSYITLRTGKALLRRPAHYPTVMISLALAFIIWCGCIPPLHQSVRRIAAFPVMNEKMYLYPVIDSSSLENFEGWPAEKPLQNIVRSHLRKLDGALLVNFRQREKYGLYEMVEDSLLASVRITFIIGHYKFNQDELIFPVRMIARRLVDNAEYGFTVSATGRYRAKSRPKSSLHYLTILIADLRRYFPYDLFSSVFCRPLKAREPRQ